MLEVVKQLAIFQAPAPGSSTSCTGDSGVVDPSLLLELQEAEPWVQFVAQHSPTPKPHPQLEKLKQRVRPCCCCCCVGTVWAGRVGPQCLTAWWLVFVSAQHPAFDLCYFQTHDSELLHFAQSLQVGRRCVRVVMCWVKVLCVPDLHTPHASLGSVNPQAEYDLRVARSAERATQAQAQAQARAQAAPATPGMHASGDNPDNRGQGHTGAGERNSDASRDMRRDSGASGHTSTGGESRQSSDCGSGTGYVPSPVFRDDTTTRSSHGSCSSGGSTKFTFGSHAFSAQVTTTTGSFSRGAEASTAPYGERDQGHHQLRARAHSSPPQVDAAPDASRNALMREEPPEDVALECEDECLASSEELDL